MNKLILNLIILTTSVVCGHAATVSGFAFKSSTVGQYMKAEATFALSQTYSNPYDPNQVTVDAEITPPSGPAYTMPCFYYVPVTYNTSNPTYHNYSLNNGNAVWMLRFAPTVTGSYSIRIKVVDAGGTNYSSAVNITCTTSTAKGFIRINSTNNQFLRFDNNTPYHPIGVNLCWNEGRLAQFFQTELNQYQTNGVTWTRYWLTDFARQALEWKSGHWSGQYSGVGTYAQGPAALLDTVVSMCASRGIYMQLVLQHHGQFSTTVNPQWADNPYNSANGGPVSNAGDFFTNATAKNLSKRQYRYVVARWGYSTAIMAWELFNEVEYTDGANANIDTWHDEMGQYLKLLDPYDHIVTTSSGKDNSTLPLMDDNTGLDMLQWHTYSSGIDNVLVTQSQNFVPNLTKPVMCGEFGTSAAYDDGGLHPDNWGDHVRKAMWKGAMSRSYNLFWYWDEYIKDKNLYSLFAPMATFLNGVDIPAKTTGIPTTNFKMVQNITANADAIAAPGLSGFNDLTTQTSFTVAADGSVPGMNNVASYFKGTWTTVGNGYLTNGLSFTATLASAGTFYMDIAGSSGSGSTNGVQVYIDNVLTTTWNIPLNAGAQTYQVAVPSGTHIIRVVNNRNDWVQVTRFRINPISKKILKPYGYTGTNYAMGYINDENYGNGDWADPAGLPTLTGAQMSVKNLQAGDYMVTWFDPKTGASLGQSTQATLSGDSLVLVLPDFKKDIAFKAERITATAIATPDAATAMNLYPNPAEDDLYISLKDGYTGTLTCDVYDVTGKVVWRTDAKALNGIALISTASLEGGAYILKVKDGNGNVKTAKFIKQ